MEDVERMYRHLVRTVRAGFPQFLTQPFEVGDLYQSILPYRLHRRELGLETNSDYEHTLLELVGGVNGYLIVEDRMRDVLSAERASGNPDPGRVRDFASAHVRLNPEALSQLDLTPAAPSTAISGATVPRLSAAAPVRASENASPASSLSAPGGDIATRRITKPITIPEGGDNCSYCKGALPGGRMIAYCPHCGQDLTLVHCPACGSELERGWKFCVTCGRGVS